MYTDRSVKTNHIFYILPAPMDYNHVNITELVYPGEQDHVVFNITIIDDGDDDETIEEFYLNVIPVENAIVLTPRITVEIGCSKQNTAQYFCCDYSVTRFCFDCICFAFPLPRLVIEPNV